MREPTVTYTGRDFSTIRESLINLVKIRFPNDWKEFSTASIGMAILDVVAWAHSQRAFYQDMQAINTYLETVNLPEAAIAIAKQLGYRLRFASSASVPVTLYPSPAQPSPVVVKKGSKILAGNITFEAAEDYVIPAGKSSWPDTTATEIPVFTEGETRTESFSSDGNPFQKFILSSIGIADSSIKVTILEEEWRETVSLVVSEASARGRDVFVGTGVSYQSYKLTELGAILEDSDETLVVLVDKERWKRVTEFTGAPKEYKAVQGTNGVTTILFDTEDNQCSPEENSIIDCLYSASGAQKVYTAEYDEDAKVTIGFGDGENGIIPPGGSSILISYRVGGGSKGNIRKGLIDGTVRGILPSKSEINVRVLNREAGSGGEDAETIDHVKIYAPRYVKTNERAVMRTDFATLASTYNDPIYGSVSFASAKLKQEIPENNTIQITLWSRDDKGRPAKATSSLKEGVLHYLNRKKTECTKIEMLDGKVVFFDITCSIEAKSGASKSLIEEKATDTLLSLFNSTYMEPGGIVSIARILKVLQEIPEVKNIIMQKIEGSYLVNIDLPDGDSIETEFSGIFSIPSGLSVVPGTFEITDGTQKINDTEDGIFSGDFDDQATNAIDYYTGAFTVTFKNPPAVGTFITSEARIYALTASTESYILKQNRLDGLTKFAPIVQREPVGIGSGLSIVTVLPSIHLPYTKNRICFVGGYDLLGAQPGGQLLAFDDGLGNIAGDASGVVNYDTGEIELTWNTMPAPVTDTVFYGRLLEAPDGSRKSFTYEVRTLSGGLGSQVSISAQNGIGRLKLRMSQLSTLNVTFEDAWDNWNGKLNSESLNSLLENSIVYENPSTGFANGILNLRLAPEVSAGQDFEIRVCPVTILVYTAFSAYVAGSPGYLKFIFADHEGRLYRDISESYPTAQLDHLSGRYKGEIVLPSAVNRNMTITYDSFMRSDSQDVQLKHDVMAAFGKINVEEIFQ